MLLRLLTRGVQLLLVVILIYGEARGGFLARMPPLSLRHLGALSDLQDALIVDHRRRGGSLQLRWGDPDDTLFTLIIVANGVDHDPLIAEVGDIHRHFTCGSVGLRTSDGYHGWLRHVYIRFIINSLKV